MCKRGLASFAQDSNYHIGLVSPYDEADTLIVQHDFMHLSFYKDDFREFVDTLVVALRGMEQAENPVAHIHPVIIRESNLAAVKAEE